MSRICYIPKKFTRDHKLVIKRANEMLAEYKVNGITVTLRSLYYRFVARGHIANSQKEYKRLGGIIGDARLAGMIDWTYLEDRTRNLMSIQHYDGPEDALQKTAAWYAVDMWGSQEWRPEVWIEKDALVGVIERVCDENDVPYFSCRGYTSLSEMWGASMRLRRNMEDGKKPFIIHFGDHDPSGIDMSRDIYDRLSKTFLADCEFTRVALTMDQIERYKPPPNPAKITDSRYKSYVAKYGDESWELDALEPTKFRELIEGQLVQLRNQKQWDRDVKARKEVKARLVDIADNWETVMTNKADLEKAQAEIVTLKATIAKQRKRKGK